MVKGIKVLQALILSLLLITVLAACGSNNGGNEAPSSKSNNSTSPAVENNSVPEKAKPTLRRLGLWQDTDYNNYPVAKMLEEETGYKVQYDMLPQDKATDKLNLLLASGEAYDIVNYSSDMALYSDYARKGALTDLTSLIEQYGPNITKAVSQQSLDALKVDGKLYAIPTKVTYEINNSILIRTDWLEKVGLPMPTTLDELTEVLKAFKEKNPGNGSNDVPFTVNGDQAMLDNILGAFGMPNNWNDVDGQLVPRVMDPAYKEYVSYLTELYKEGLLDREFVVNKGATTKEKFTSGRAGAVIVHWADFAGIVEALTKNIPDAKISFTGALEGPNGEKGFVANAGFDRLTFIPKASKNPEDAIKWINASLEPETFKNLAIGQEGVHYTEENGAYLPILPIFNDERNLANNFMSGSDETLYPLYWQARVHKNPVQFEAFDFLNNQQPDEVKIPNLLSLAPYMPEYSKNNMQLESMVTDYTVKLIAGAEMLSGLEAFQAKYQAAGGEVSANEINEWYSTIQK